MATKKKKPIKAGDIVWAIFENRVVEFRVERVVTTIDQSWKINEGGKSSTHHQTENTNYYVRELIRSHWAGRDFEIPAVGNTRAMASHQIFRTKQDLPKSL